MRLIDAEKLNIHDVSLDYYHEVQGVTGNEIDDAPTVEAIPVKYAEEFAGELLVKPQFYSRRDKEMMRMGVQRLIWEWEKKNDDN